VPAVELMHEKAPSPPDVSRLSVFPSTDTPPEPTGDSAPSPLPPDSGTPSHRWPRLDRLGLTQAIGGFVLGLIALFSSYDHISFAGNTLKLEKQWGIVFIAASVATILVDAELATRSRIRAANEAAEERDRADRWRNRAAEARERQAQDAERQTESLEFLHQAALLSGRVQLEPNPTNRARFQFFLTLISGEIPPEGEDL
jgi:hypothetical protein